MSRQISVLFAVAALAVSVAHAADRASDSECTRQDKVQQETAARETIQREEPTQQAVLLPTPPITLEAMFAASAEGESIETEDGVSAAVGAIEVVVARIGPDGKPVLACVDNIKAARRFFDAPIGELQAKQPKEQ